MECKIEHFRHRLLHDFRKGKDAVQAAKTLRDNVYGDEDLKERQRRNWFEKFLTRDFSPKHNQRSGRPVEVNEDEIKTIIEAAFTYLHERLQRS